MDRKHTTVFTGNKLKIFPKLKEVLHKASVDPEGSQGCNTRTGPAVQGLAQKSSSLLSNLDRMKDAVHYRGGSTGETPYFVSSAAIESISFTLQHNNISLLRSVHYGNCTDLERKFLFNPKLYSQKLGHKVKNPNFVSLDTFFYKLEYPSAISSIYFFIGYLEVLFDSYPDFADKPFFNDLVEAFLWLSNLSPVSFVSYAKYITAFPMAKYMKQDDLPPLPKDFPQERQYLFIGRLKKFLRNRVYSFNRKNTSFMQGLLQGVKRAAYKVPESFIIDSLISHASILSRNSAYNQNKIDYDQDLLNEVNRVVGSWGDEDIKFTSVYEERRLSFQVFEKDFLSKVEKLSKHFTLTPLDVFSNKWVPSSSGAFEQNKALGGQIGFISENYVLEDPEHLYPYPIKVPTLNTDTEWSVEEKLSLSTTPALNTNLDLISMHNYNNKYYEFRGEHLPESIIRNIITLPSRSPDKPIDRVVALAEPLKVRTITVGEAELYYASKPLQQALWSHIGHLSQFSLIKEPLEIKHLDELIRQEIILMRKLKMDLLFTDFVSGDYKAATDGLDIHFSKLALKPFLDNVKRCYPELEKYLEFVAPALSEHKLCYKIKNYDSQKFEDGLKRNNIPYYAEYPDDEENNYFYVDQHNGQLMGSPLSFPILCIVNLIAYWRSMEIYTTKSIKPKDLPVKVNGDDILFRSNREHYAIWKEQIKYVSFTLSLGKNYIHKYLLTVNSVMYSFHLTTADRYLYNLSTSNEVIDHDFIGDWRFQEISYMNPGLLTAQSKGTMRDKTRTLPLGELYEIAVGNASSRLRAHQRFIHYNLDKIQEMTDNGKFNLFIPVHLGGLGFKLFPEVIPEVNFTIFQRRFASFLLFKTILELKKGEYPKKYFSALVDDGTRSHLPHFDKKSNKPLFLEGNLESEIDDYIKFDGFERVSAPTLSQRVIVSEIDLKYRLPSKSLMREFNRAVRDDIYLPYMQEMPIEDIIAAPRKPSLFSRIKFPQPDIDWSGTVTGISSDYQTIPYFDVELYNNFQEEEFKRLYPNHLKLIRQESIIPPSDYQLEVEEFFMEYKKRQH